MRKIKFKNKIYYLVNDGNESPICTKKQFTNGLCSYAHLFPDGKIKRFNEVIGSKKDIKIIAKVKDLKPKFCAFENMSTEKWEEEKRIAKEEL